MTEFRILGPLEVEVDGDALVLGSGRQRTLLAILLLHRNEVVSADRLIEALWEDAPPETAAKALHVHVSQLRKRLGRERVLTLAPGYRLCVEPGELDLERFVELEERERFAEALALWRGPPLAEFAYERFASAEIARLQELRLACLERRIDADLAAGRHTELVGELEALVREHPLRERACAQLMLALYRCNRQADALAAYRRTRAALVAELGIESARQLRELHQQILNQDPTLDVPTASHGERVASSGSGFIGREAELAYLLAALDEALFGSARVVLLSGEPGIGKTRLVEELANHARRRGANVLSGRCWEAGGAPAYWPWVQALRGYIQTSDPEVVRRQLAPGAAELAQILPEVIELVPGLAAPSVSEPESARFRLFDAIASSLRRMGSEQPVVLFLDDLHAADAPTLLLLQFVARSLSDCSLLVVAAYRDVGPRLGEPLSAALGELSREPVTRRLPLTGLEEQDVASFIEQISGRAPTERLAGDLHRATEGNPLFVGEIVRLLVTERAFVDSAASSTLERTVPEGVKEVIGRRLGHLSEECKRVLTAASVAGREFRLDTLGVVAGIEVDELLSVLDEAMIERVVIEVPGRAARLRFGHALIRDTLYDELTPGRRAQLHRRVGEAIEKLYGVELEPHLPELAHHFLAAAPAGGSDKAIDYARRAAERATAQLAHEEAARLYELALSVAPAGGARCDLLLALGDAQARSGATDSSKGAYREAADLAELLGLPEQLARAALGYGGRFIWDASRDDPAVVSLLERALSALEGDHPLRVRLLARLAGGPLRDASFPAERRVAASREALAAARRLGDPGTTAYALAGWVLANDSPDKALDRLELATELVEVAEIAGEKERAVEGHEVRLLSLLEIGEMEAARRELVAMAQLATELRQPPQQWFVAAYRALLALLEGRFAAAEELVSHAFALGAEVQAWSAEVSYRLQLWALRREQGRLEDVRDLVGRSVNEYPTYPIWRCVAANMAAELGEPEARELFEALASDDFAAIPFDEEWLVAYSLLAETTHRLADENRAAILYDRLVPYSDRVGVVYIEFSTGAVSRYLGVLASTRASWAEAEQHFEEAMHMNRQIGALPLLARTKDDFAQMLLVRGASGDKRRARALFDEALVTYRKLGMDASQSPFSHPASLPS